MTSVEAKGLGYYAYLNQGTTWLPRDRPALPIVDMDPAWRRNAARWMLRRARIFEMYYSLGELEHLGAPAYREVVGEQADGQVLYRRGPALSAIDLMSEHTVDGWDAASFMQTLKGFVENPLRLLSA